jgi:hypothetical protein
VDATAIGKRRPRWNAPAMHKLRLITAIMTLMASATTPRPVPTGNVVPGRDLVGTWNCTYTAGAHPTTYSATFAYAMGRSWMHEIDSSGGAANVEALYTYEPKSTTWTAVITGSDRTVTIFRAVGASVTHIVYHSVYPDASMTDIFDRLSATKYALHFTQIANGKTTRSSDVCIKT